MALDNEGVVEAISKLLTPIAADSQYALQGFFVTPDPDKKAIPVHFGFIGIPDRDVLKRGDMRKVIAQLKEMADMDPLVEDKPQVGYLRFQPEGTTTLANFVIQTRPTRIGEEILVRRLGDGDLTLPPIVRESEDDEPNEE